MKEGMSDGHGLQSGPGSRVLGQSEPATEPLSPLIIPFRFLVNEINDEELRARYKVLQVVTRNGI